MKDRKRKRINPYVFTDTLSDRLGDRSVQIMDGTIKKVAASRSGAFFAEDWFARPFRVAEILADRLAVAEHCLKEGIGWSGYRYIARIFSGG